MFHLFWKSQQNKFRAGIFINVSNIQGKLGFRPLPPPAKYTYTYIYLNLYIWIFKSTYYLLTTSVFEAVDGIWKKTNTTKKSSTLFFMDLLVIPYTDRYWIRLSNIPKKTKMTAWVTWQLWVVNIKVFFPFCCSPKSQMFRIWLDSAKYFWIQSIHRTEFFLKKAQKSSLKRIFNIFFNTFATFRLSNNFC